MYIYINICIQCMRVRVCYNMYTYSFIDQAWSIFLELQVFVTFFSGIQTPSS